MTTSSPDQAPTHTPAVARALCHFEFGHLRPDLAAVSQRFHSLAHELAGLGQEAETELLAALHKLTEAKDWAVRAAVEHTRATTPPGR